MANSTLGKLSHNMKDYDAYGFDLDLTLARYHLPELFRTFSNCLAKDLIETDSKLYGNAFPDDWFKLDFCSMRMVIFDIPKGNFFKVSNNGTILHASHGTRFMDDAEIKKVFGENRKWDRYSEMKKEVDNLGENEIRFFDNFFDSPILMVAAQLVNYFDKLNTNADPSELKEYTSFYKDLLKSVKDLFSDYPDSFFFKDWLADTGKLVRPCRQEVQDWLRGLKAKGKVVFALTSSVPLFMEASMKFILDSIKMSHPSYYLNTLGVKLDDDQLNRIPAPRFELATHVTLKTTQAGGLLGAMVAAPIVSLVKGQRDLESIQQRAFRYGKTGIITGLVLGPLVTAAFVPSKSLDSIHDRTYRIRCNKKILTPDRVSFLGLAVGLGAAQYAGAALEQGAVFGYIGGFLCGTILTKFV